eukprot:3637950-Amphidinium_carterae.1
MHGHSRFDAKTEVNSLSEEFLVAQELLLAANSTDFIPQPAPLCHLWHSVNLATFSKVGRYPHVCGCLGFGDCSKASEG